MNLQTIAGTSILCLAIAFSPQLHADDGAAPRSEPPPSLDAQLLDDLSDDLLEGLDAGPSQPAPAKVEPGPIEGEDIGAADTAGDDNDPRARIEQKMRQVEQRLAERDPSVGTQDLQRQIAQELTALLEQLKRQQQEQQQSQSNSSQPQNQQQRQPSPSEQQNDSQKPASNPSNQAANKPTRDSEERNGKKEETAIKPEDLKDLIQRAWGNLPPQVRERMQSAAQEQFLPRYETLIEDYFKRLTETSQP